MSHVAAQLDHVARLVTERVAMRSAWRAGVDPYNTYGHYTRRFTKLWADRARREAERASRSFVPA